MEGSQVWNDGGDCGSGANGGEGGGSSGLCSGGKQLQIQSALSKNHAS